MGCVRIFLLLAICTAASQAMSQQAPVLPPVPAFGAPLAADSLAALRGGTSSSSSDMQVVGTTASNSAQQVTTGSNSITGGAFANFSGLPIVVQNTGANVLIQNAVILNLQMH